MRAAFLAPLLALPFLAPAAAHAQTSAAPITFCSGISGGNYDFAAIQAGRQTGGKVADQNTGGSLDNLAAVSSGACQVGMTQADALFLYMTNHPKAQATVEIARDMYPEYGHLICNATVKDITALGRGNTVLVGRPGSGSAVMWDAIKQANKAYDAVGTLPLDGFQALGKVSDGTDAQCMLFVAGLKSSTMLKADTFAKGSAGGLHLTYMRDPALFSLRDAKGHPIYNRATIPGGTYPLALQAGGVFSSGAVDTIEVRSVLIASSAFVQSQPDGYEAFLEAMAKAMPAINDRVQPH